MRTARTWKRTLAAVVAGGLLVAACGSDDDDDGGDATDAPAETEAAEEDAPADTEAMDEDEAPADTEAMDEDAPADTEAMDEGEDEDAGGGEELPLEGMVEVAAGTTLNLDECPDDWDPFQGVDGDEIRIGSSLPQSGQVAAFGAVGEGMAMYFDYLNDNDPIVEGQDLVLVLKDDAYEAGRTVANVEEMLDVDDIFLFANIIGTPNSLAARPITQDACVPQLLNSTGFPLWGDPATWPWTIGGLLNYETETALWCENIVEELGEGATVAALIMNNDFGKTYQGRLEQCADEGQIDLVEVQLHDPAAPDVTNEMTTLVATDADVFVAGTTAAFCPQAAGTVAATEWRPLFYMSYTCNALSSFFTPIQDQAAALAEAGSGVRMTNSNKVCGDPAFADDSYVQLVEQVLDEYGGVTCADGSYSTGVLLGLTVEQILRDAAAMPGGLNRVNVMAATWNLDFVNDGMLGGTLKSDGVNDAFLAEAAQIQQVVVVDGNLTFESLSDIIDLEGQGGSFSGG